MSTDTASIINAEAHPVSVRLGSAPLHHDRLTVAFRPILAIPHLLLVGGPVAAALWMTSHEDARPAYEWTAGGGVFGAAAAVIAIIAWFAIVFTGRYPAGLWSIVAFYLRWRVRASAYTALLRDEYPPFGDEPYPAALVLSPPAGPRHRVSAGFRVVLVIPHLVVLWLLGIAWTFTTIVAWFAILFTGRFPRPLYEFGAGALQWNARVEAYLLLLHDDYPPFGFD